MTADVTLTYAEALTRAAKRKPLLPESRVVITPAEKGWATRRANLRANDPIMREARQ